MSEITVIIPTLNEEEGISSVLNELPSSIEGYDVKKIVIDGGSEDNTVEEAKKQGAEVLIQKTRGGKGSAMKEALDSTDDSDIYAFIDGDFTYSPRELTKLAKPVINNKADMVVGKRTEAENGSMRTLNKLGNKIFNYIVSKFYSVKIEDMLSGFRVIDKETLEDLALIRKGFGIETEITIETIEKGKRIKEIPIEYRKRKGDTKLHPLKDGWLIAKTILWMMRDTRPMFFFGFISFIFFLIGLYPAFLTLEQKLATGKISNLAPPLIAIFFFLFGLQIFLFGLMADQQRSIEKKTRQKISQLSK